jgi:uncharacterized protein YjbI with pentapeptide repeats
VKFRYCWLAAFAATAWSGHALAQMAGTNVNMVAGTTLPGGDPFLERQNEPSIAVSSRNSAHLMGGANDYRTVDIPVSASLPTGDAWLGVFKSFDAGVTWRSTLIPCFPQDPSSSCSTSPFRTLGLTAGADPTVRAGTNGMLYYTGLAFQRNSNTVPSVVFMARYVDDNNNDNSDTMRYLDTNIIDQSASGNFDDKPSMAVDLPRKGATVCTIPAPPGSTQQTTSFLGGNIYVAYTLFVGGEESTQAQIMFKRSVDCGKTWSSALTLSSTTQTSQGASLAVDPVTGNVWVFWRQFAVSQGQTNAIVYSVSTNAGQTFTAPAVLTPIVNTFDQGTNDEYQGSNGEVTGLSFRTNDYPSAVANSSGRIFVAWSDRTGPSSTGTGGPTADSRIMFTYTNAFQQISQSPPQINVNWSTPAQADPNRARGHQFMPAMGISGPKLTLIYYDLRNDDEKAVFTPITPTLASPDTGDLYSEVFQTIIGPQSEFFTPKILDVFTGPAALPLRNIIDVRAAQADASKITGVNGPALQFQPSILVTQYNFGTATNDRSETIQQLQFDAPNLPIFQQGTSPFLGDYLDVGGPTFQPNSDGTWHFNSTDSNVMHAVWTDNRDVIQPADGNWDNFTAAGFTTSGPSFFDPTQTRPACTEGQTGNRNQNIYTSSITPGLVLYSRSNSKPLGVIQRAYPVTAENHTDQIRSFLFKILTQPAGGTASFLQTASLLSLTVNVQPQSTVTRTVFVTSTNPGASVQVSVTEVTQTNSLNLFGTVTLNPDPLNPGITEPNPNISNPNISNPNISNPNISNPNISNANILNFEVYNPNISNPNISNPNISNPNISNPNISNPNISNPNISNPNISNINIINPNISNPNISNPNISNPNISNPNISNINISNTALSDTTWTVTNVGNTTTGYSAQFLQNAAPPANTNFQLTITRPYFTPNVNVDPNNGLAGCSLIQETHYVTLANYDSLPQSIVNTNAGTVTNAALTNPDVPTFTIAPGEIVYLTLRVYHTGTGIFDASQYYTPIIVSQGANTGNQTPSRTYLTILSNTLPQAVVPNSFYSTQVVATGGMMPYAWSSDEGIPPGLSIDSASGIISGIPTVQPGTYSFNVYVFDNSNPIENAQALVTIKIVSGNPVPLQIVSPMQMPSATEGVNYKFTFQGNGGAGGYQWASNSLPSGFTLSPGGVLTAYPTYSGGPFSFSVTLSDQAHAATVNPFNITIAPGLAITTPAPNIGSPNLGQTYTLGAPFIKFTGTGGTPFFYKFTTPDPGDLPPGLTLDPSGAIIGTVPVNTCPEYPFFTFTVTLTDSVYYTSQQFTATVGCAG